MGHHENEHEQGRGGMPGDGAGRREETGKSGVHPLSGAEADADMPARTPAEWGQGIAGAAGYEDAGASEIQPPRRPAASGSIGRNDAAEDSAPADLATDRTDVEARD
ncbi:MAG: hypothetical protein M3N29_08785 [Chloroflexota bacterium]|nr:hypothetical protein [Chloroflexota bacterium]